MLRLVRDRVRERENLVAGWVRNRIFDAKLSQSRTISHIMHRFRFRVTESKLCSAIEGQRSINNLLSPRRSNQRHVFVVFQLDHFRITIPDYLNKADVKDKFNELYCTIFSETSFRSRPKVWKTHFWDNKCNIWIAINSVHYVIHVLRDTFILGTKDYELYINSK